MAEPLVPYLSAVGHCDICANTVLDAKLHPNNPSLPAATQLAYCHSLLAATEVANCTQLANCHTAR
jgi:hypothetical protein